MRKLTFTDCLYVATYVFIITLGVCAHYFLTVDQIRNLLK